MTLRTIIPILVILAGMTFLAFTPWAEGIPSLKYFALVGVAGLLVGGIEIKRRQPSGSVDPFSLYAWLLAGVCLVVLAVYGLTFIGPIPVIGVTVLLAIVVVVLLIRRDEPLRQRRAVSGKCTECGYDLRESHERCPECGAQLPEELQRRRRIAAELRAKRQADESNADT